MQFIYKLIFDRDLAYRRGFGDDDFLFNTYDLAKRELLKITEDEGYRLSFHPAFIENNSIDIEFINKEEEKLYASIQAISIRSLEVLEVL